MAISFGQADRDESVQFGSTAVILLYYFFGSDLVVDFLFANPVVCDVVSHRLLSFEKTLCGGKFRWFRVPDLSEWGLDLRM
jgi:hypothetical protein